jgi:starch phosphorylase
VQLYANGINAAAPEVIGVKPVKGTIADQGNDYEIKLITTRPASDYTARIVPCYQNISVPLEDNHILWQG